MTNQGTDLVGSQFLSSGPWLLTLLLWSMERQGILAGTQVEHTTHLMAARKQGERKKETVVHTV